MGPEFSPHGYAKIKTFLTVDGPTINFLGRRPQLRVSGGTVRVIQVPGPARALIGLLAGIKLFLVGLINRFKPLKFN